VNKKDMSVELRPSQCATCAHARPAQPRHTPHYLVCTYRDDDLMPLWLENSHTILRLVLKSEWVGATPQICDVYLAAPDAGGGRQK